jgi:hypothetical protein
MNVRRWLIIVIGAFLLLLFIGSFADGEQAQNVSADNNVAPPPAGITPANTPSISNLVIKPHVSPPIRGRRENWFLAFGKFATDVVPVATDSNGHTSMSYSLGLTAAEATNVVDCITTEMIHARGGTEDDPLARPLFRHNLECPVGIVLSDAANHTFKLLFRGADTKPKKAAVTTALVLLDIGHAAIDWHNIQQLEKPKYQQGR